ncbi:MAG: FKBP-type peptidyl-prolyl cis-trans isomerase [Thermodesulfobacteriota bacterium]|jgi:FKBP-type peptidyl-prolyl cis-trans isomerase FklB
MKLKVLAGLGILFLASQVYGEENLVLKNQKDKVSYSIGMEIGRNFKRQSIDVDPDLLVKGVKDAYSGEKLLLTEQEANDTMAAFQKELMAKQQELQKKLGEKNKPEGETFLAENKKKEDVKTLPSGLQYKVIKAGNGKKPILSDTVTTHYRGTLIDGTEFDSSYRRGQPATFPVKGVIPGWTEALQLMDVGAKWQLFIPSNLAYGERGAGRNIGPNATLIFEIELISIEEKKGEEKEDKKPSSPEVK